MQQQQRRKRHNINKSGVWGNASISNSATTSNKNVGSYSISNLSGVMTSDQVGAIVSSGALAVNKYIIGGKHIVW